eukprot:TRINITY_DN10260_c0_g1_i3.p1 TRINITY_DN10260_c0_g1~~TRINITY_DN10260_c0_g1_i3.p1  ORF type:complete len:103 (+),score=22.34 TRINITY_DN10260_c0_g1_i3:152-460(+)
MVGHNATKTQAAWSEVNALPTPPNCPSKPSVVWTTADISNNSQVRLMIEFSLAAFGGLDVLVNDAGLGYAGPMPMLDSPAFPDAFENNPIMDINLKLSLIHI